MHKALYSSSSDVTPHATRLITEGMFLAGGIMRNIYKFMVLIVCLQFAAMPAAAEEFFTHAVLNLPFEVYVDGTWVSVFESQEDWDLFYNEHVPDYIDESFELRYPPEFDFENYMVIAGGLGVDVFGDRLSIEKVIATSSTVYIIALVVSKGVGCGTLAVVRWPTIAILIPKPEGEIEFFRSDVRSADCVP